MKRINIIAKFELVMGLFSIGIMTTMALTLLDIILNAAS